MVQNAFLILVTLAVPVVTHPLPAATSARRMWTMTLEEPTGIYRREGEVVTATLNLNEGLARKNQLYVLGPDGREVLSQIEVTETHADGSVRAADVLFKATLIPGERPQFLLVADPESGGSGSPGPNEITARRIGVGRIDMENSRFGVIVNLGLEGTEPAIISAFNRTAGPQRMLNLVDTSPDVDESLPAGRKNGGIGTFLEGRDRNGHFDKVELLESGPLRGRIRISGAQFGGTSEAWEFIWHAASPVLRWQVRLDRGPAGSAYGYFFSCLSASPYMPFTRWMEGSEQNFPDGWETDNPPDHPIGPRREKDLPGGHVVYYRREENYGALGIYELDRSLVWNGIGARQFHSSANLRQDDQSTEIALAFPRWKGTETVLEARMEYRRFMQPILCVIKGPFPLSAARTRVEGQSAAIGPVTVKRVMLSKPAPEQHNQPVDISLDGEWKLNWAEKSEGEKLGYHSPSLEDSSWHSVIVPGSVHTQMLLPPKYFARDAEWISSKEWWYRRSFIVPAEARGKRLRLRFEATDYYADIYLNGSLLGRHEGYIDPHEIEIGGRLNRGAANQLAVRVWTPVTYYWRHRPYTVKGSYGAVDQKPDNITAVGITHPVRIRACGPLVIEDLAVDTRLNSDGSADVLLDVEVEAGNSQPRTAEIMATLVPRNFIEPEGLQLRTRLAVAPPRRPQRFVLHVDKPRLWWTWDHGKPNLYTLDVTVLSRGVVSDRRSLAVGIREIEHYDWKFYLNGKRMFIRGTNAYYHLFMSEMRRGDYVRDLDLMRRMNINVIRLHCHFSNPDFYDLADELGIMIWQDYLEAWYPEDREFSLKAAALYDPLIRYVRNHPSVAIWATSDEESLENYRDLTKHLEPRLYALDPQRRPVVRSTGRYGDGHVYYGWYGGSIWQYGQMTEKFVSELGATALPNYESLIRFLPDAWPIGDHRDRWIFHKLQIPEAMRAWGEPGNLTLKEYIPRTQTYVARLFQLAIERMRRLKYQPAGGILHFHAVDIWPSVTMAAIDFYRQPTRAYHTVQKSFQMVLPSFAYDRDTWRAGTTVHAELWVINDHWYDIPGATVSWELRNGAGKTEAAGYAAQGFTLGADTAVRLTEVSCRPPGPGSYTLVARVHDVHGALVSENTYEFEVS